MRIALVTPGFSASQEDWCIPALLNLVRELARHHEVHVFTLRYPHRRGTYRVYGATVHALGGAQTRKLGRLALLARALVRVVSQARTHPFDVIHGLWAHEPGFVATRAARLLGIPALVSLLGGELVALPAIGYGGQLSLLNRALVRSAIKHSQRITAGSESLARMSRSHMGGQIPATLPLGVDTALFQPLDKPGRGPVLRGERRVLQVASLTPVKDQATLLQAFALVARRDPGVHLHLVGDGNLRSELQKQGEDLGVSHQITFHGEVEHHELPAYYRAVHLCVVTSRFESQGMAVLEAAACSRLTVGTRVGVLPELAPATHCVEVGEVSALAGVLESNLNDPTTLVELGRASRQAVVDGYGVETTVSRLCELYGDLVTESRRARDGQ